MVVGFAGVRGDVGLEGARLGERRAAEVTDERPVTGVRSLVVDAVRVGGEAAAAVLAHVRLVTGVRSHVEHQAGILPERLATYVAQETLEIDVLLLPGAFVNPRVPLQLDLLLEGLVALLARVRLRSLVTLFRILVVATPVRAGARARAARAALISSAVRVRLMLRQRLLRVVRLPADLAGETLTLVIRIQLLSYPAVYQLDGRLVVGWLLRLRSRFSLVVPVSIHVALQSILPKEFHIADATNELFLVVHERVTLQGPLGGIALVAMFAMKDRRVVVGLKSVAAGIAVGQVGVSLLRPRVTPSLSRSLCHPFHDTTVILVLRFLLPRHFLVVVRRNAMRFRGLRTVFESSPVAYLLQYRKNFFRIRPFMSVQVSDHGVGFPEAFVADSAQDWLQLLLGLVQIRVFK